MAAIDPTAEPATPADPGGGAGPAAVLAANRRFYEAFEARDLDAMSDVWAHDEDVACTHPGWVTLHGWAAVASSWFALFQQGAPMQFILTDERARIVGDMAWVTVDENLIGTGESATVAALNLFRRTSRAWLLVAHHGSPVQAARS
ncbi:MAG: nuclear transport factor 2 family protein [Actinobacteria bacterium]|nr:nuclear transport factor 2 family protein [Actinomycetota bacterium]